MVSVKCSVSILFLLLILLFSDSESTSGKANNLIKFISKSWKRCINASTSLSLCFKQQSLLTLDNLINTNDPLVLPGEMLTLVKNKLDSENSEYPKVLTENDLDKYLPKEHNLQDKTLNLLLESAYTKFLSSRSLQIKFPESPTYYKNVKEEGRGDKKKGNGYATGALLATMMMLPMALSGIGMLAGKSLMVSMLALMMAALLATRKSGDGGGHSSYEVISIPSGGGHHHGRRISTNELPYNAYEPSSQ